MTFRRSQHPCWNGCLFQSLMVFPENGWSSCLAGRVNVKEGNKSLPFSSPRPLDPGMNTRKILFLCGPMSLPCSIARHSPLWRLPWFAPSVLTVVSGEAQKISCLSVLPFNGSLFVTSLEQTEPLLWAYFVVFSCGTCSRGNKASVGGGMAWMWLFQWNSKAQCLLVSWGGQLHFSGRTLACMCFIHVGLTRWDRFNQWKSTTTHQIREDSVLGTLWTQGIVDFSNRIVNICLVQCLVLQAVSCNWPC